ncbi:acetyl-CoA C-acyltransferase [Elongatibacter sediminis]|uniref:Acetyl-CoA C-acyltransferase n=1 Tax=Elongatibacter sediminis TaxID=3119006 RepID=A0AAW9R8V3_9GAMM
MADVFIYDAIRTARTRAKETGGLHDLNPLDLMGSLYRSLEARTGLDPATVGEVVLGCVTQHGEQAGNIAKTSTLYAGWPASLSGITVNRFCSSGLDAVNFAALKVAAGQEDLAIGGGVEMMSRVPMLSDQAATFMDPKLAARSRILMMGNGADLIASLYDVSREEADQVAVDSQQRAARARAEGWYASIVPVENPVKGITVTEDECIRPDVSLESLGQLEPAFAKLGAMGPDAAQLAAFPELKEIRHIHTAGNSPAMCDAASAVLVGSEAAGRALGRSARAVIRDAVNAADDPLLVLSGAVLAAGKLMERNGLSVDDVDLFEIHEAFAATVVKARRDLGIPAEKLNVNGGVIALGHPLGATGAIMLGTLLDEMERRDLRRGIVSASGAGGGGAAMLIER